VSNTTYSSLHLKPVNPAALGVLRDLFKATPLYIFATALKEMRGPKR
jgi:hypothetical protein